MDLKKEAAAKAITLIRNKTIVGLGTGSTISHVVSFLKKEVENGLEIKVVTSSFSTRQLLLKNHFVVLQAASLEQNRYLF